MTFHSTQSKGKGNGNNPFQARKEHCLGKRDKSNAGRIDPKAVDICAAINARPEYCTTSSCAGRCFLYRGDGIKSHHHYAKGTGDIVGDGEGEGVGDGDDQGGVAEEAKESRYGFFERYRVNHDIIRDAPRYFNLDTLPTSSALCQTCEPSPNTETPSYNAGERTCDATGGGDPVRSIGQFDHKASPNTPVFTGTFTHAPVWLRFEPFILHVNCQSLTAAARLMDAARPSFKNVGLTSFSSSRSSTQTQKDKFIVAVWGDEGLDLPLSTPASGSSMVYAGCESWLQTLVNERHARNWEKIARFAKSVLEMPPATDDDDWENENDEDNGHERTHPKKFDVVGDVAIIHGELPEDCDDAERERIGRAIMAKNNNIKVCVARTSALTTPHRSPNSSLIYLAASHPNRLNKVPLITTHTEYQIKCLVNLHTTFFTTRMGPERLRLCNSCARGEHVLVLFSGVGLEVLQIAGRTQVETVLGVELNHDAVVCAERGRGLLERNKSVKCLGASERCRFVEGDVLDVLPGLEYGSFDRVLAPRPKHGGTLDGDLGTGDHGLPYLLALLPCMKPMGSECHWYDFVAQHELPNCQRTRAVIRSACDTLGLGFEVLHVATVGSSIAKRQFRVCVDFRLIGSL